MTRTTKAITGEKTMTKTESHKVANFTLPITINPQRIADLLCGAIEGGSDYWLEGIEYILADGMELADFRKGGKLAKQISDDYFHPTQIIPLFEGCGLRVETNGDWRNLAQQKEGKPRKPILNPQSIQTGLRIMAEKHKSHFGDFMSENDDAVTADVFLQCCLFGELVFG